MLTPTGHSGQIAIQDAPGDFLFYTELTLLVAAIILTEVLPELASKEPQTESCSSACGQL